MFPSWKQDEDAVNTDANLFLLHQCLLVDHETQSGRWWGACQCQRPDKDVPLPLYKSLPHFPLWSEPGAFYLWVNLREKSNLSVAHLHSNHIKCDTLETDNFISLFSSSLQSSAGIWGQWEGKSPCFHATVRLFWGEQQFSKTCWINNKLALHKQCWEYSSLLRSVIDLLLMLDETPCFSLGTSATGLHYLLYPLSMYLK